MLAVLKWVIVFLIIMLVAIPLNGLLISATWGWFIRPITGAREITLVEGVGLSIFLSIAGSALMASIADKLSKDDNIESATYVVVRALAGPLFGLGWAWVWHTFAMS